MKRFHRLLLPVLACGASASALAHTGHGTGSIAAGLAHPLGLDHLLAMVAVGVWSVAALPVGRRLAGPALFLLVMLGGAAAGAAMPALPLVEIGIAASVALFGALLLAPRALPVAAGLAVVGAAALLHGLAHGAELPVGAAFAGYAAGFLAATAALHGLGLGLGALLLRAGRWGRAAAAAALGAAGVWLLALA